jgi:hypothetical protein
MKKLIGAICSLSFLFVGCAKDSDSNSAGALPLQTSSVNADGCLNVEKLMLSLHGRGFDRHAMSTTTDLNFTSGRDIRQNFAYILTLALFQYNRGLTTDLDEFIDAKQTGCDVVRLRTNAGENEEYQITFATQNHLVFSKEGFREYAIEFFPPATVKFNQSFTVSDYNCGADKVAVHVHTEKRMHFEANGQTLPTTETLSGRLVKYLTDLPIEADVLADLREHSTGSNDVEVTTTQLKQLTELVVPESILQCTGSNHDPEPTPEPDPNPDDDTDPPPT